MSRKKEIQQAEAYALEQMRVLILDALEADVEGAFEHEDGSNEFLIEHDAPNVCYILIRVRLEVAHGDE